MSPLPVTQTRWLQGDIERAELFASNGDISVAARLYRGMQRDGTVQGLLGTRSGGLLRLPRRFTGPSRAIDLLEGVEGRTGLFDLMFPPAELERLVEDGIVLGIGLGEFVQMAWERFPKLVRLDPEFLLYRFDADCWFYRSIHGLLPITPGDGRWVLHTPRGEHEPWNYGLWKALARSFVSKEHAVLYRDNYAGKLANPARVAVSPQGASDMQKQSWFQRVMAWGVNSVFGVTPGYDVKLLESNGRGYEVFKDIIATSDLEFMVALAGQIVTVTGGAGFANANIHQTIRSDLIQRDGGGLSATLNRQAITHVVADLLYGAANDNAEDAEADEAGVFWDTRPPADLKAGAESLSAAAKAVDDLTAALSRHTLRLDVAAILARYAVPVLGDTNGDAKPDVAPSATAPTKEPMPVPSSEELAA